MIEKDIYFDTQKLVMAMQVDGPGRPWWKNIHVNEESDIDKNLMEVERFDNLDQLREENNKKKARK